MGAAVVVVHWMAWWLCHFSMEDDPPERMHQPGPFIYCNEQLMFCLRGLRWRHHHGESNMGSDPPIFWFIFLWTPPICRGCPMNFPWFPWVFPSHPCRVHGAMAPQERGNADGWDGHLVRSGEREQCGISRWFGMVDSGWLMVNNG